MHRREFLKFQAAAALSIDPAALGFPTRLLADASPDIAVVKGSPAAATRAAVELLGGMSVASYEWYGRQVETICAGELFGSFLSASGNG